CCSYSDSTLHFHHQSVYQLAVSRQSPVWRCHQQPCSVLCDNHLSDSAVGMDSVEIELQQPMPDYVVHGFRCLDDLDDCKSGSTDGFVRTGKDELYRSVQLRSAAAERLAVSAAVSETIRKHKAGLFSPAASVSNPLVLNR
ncbi:hypothetical protein, partial [uncultured Faecalibaculum sp.]|uniref:hypothetical protein n=1 Tax=uncultured Faecalibaculum sp. TaxID=1729681 RepID=UPI002711E753